MVLLTTTPQILNLISTLPPAIQSKINSSDPLPTSLDSPISHKTVVSISRLSKDDVSLNKLLRGTRPYYAPPPPKPEPSPEYKALMARLRAEQERREYKALLVKHTYDGTDVEDEEEDPISPSLVLNILLSVVLCALAVFYVSRWWASDGIRVLLSLAAGLVVGIAEVTVYAGYLRKITEAKVKERRKKEKKVLIGEYKGPGDEGDAQSVILQESEKEVIWGKGKHGGMRRRVREKWEKEQESKEIR